MQKMEIINAAGKSTSVAAGQNHIKIAQPGTTVKVSLSKEMISGAQKDKDNLILVQKNGSKVIIEDFFKTEGGLKNKLILEDGAKSYEANYNSEHFAGLSFVPVKAANDQSANDGEISTAVWLVPLIAVAAAGIGIAVYNNRDKGDSHSSDNNDNGDSKEKQALDNTQKTTVARESELAKAQKTLSDAVKAMQDNPTPETIKAVEEANAAVKKAMDALDSANAFLQNAIDAAKAKGINTAAAEKVHAQAAADESSASNTYNKAAELVKTAIALTTDSAKAAQEQATQALKSASTAADLANKQPGKGTIDDAKAKLTAANQSLEKLATQIDQLSQQIAKAQKEGFNVTQASARLKTLQDQFAKDSAASKTLADAVAQAEQSVQDLNAAQKAVDDADAALKAAAEQKALAAEKLSAAQAQKDEVLKNNQLDRVDEVNKAIEEANKALDNARQATEAANAAAARANADIDKINSSVDASLKPQKINSADNVDLKPIDKGLQVDENKTIVESLESFLHNLVSSVTDVWNKIVNSKPLEFLNKVASEIVSSIQTVAQVLGQKATAVVDAVKTVAKALSDFFVKEPIDFVKNLLNTTWDKLSEAVTETFSTVKNLVSSVASGIGKAIGDALKGMNLLDYLNPLKWIELVKNVVVNSVKNVVNNLWDTLKTIPEKIVKFISDAVSDYAGTLGKMISDKFNIVKNAVTDVVKTLYEGFIKNPIDKIIQPILDKIADLLSHPIESIQKLISGINDLVKSGFDIIKSLFDLPCKWIQETVKLVKDIFNSFNGDKVKNGDGSEIKQMLQKLMSEKHTDSSSDVNSLLKSHSSNGDVNLNKLVPESPATKNAPVADHQPSSSVANYHSPSAADDMHSSLPVAA